MKPLERTNVAAAVLTVGVILALFSPLLDPARLSVADQVARLKRGAVSAADFDYAFLRFDAGKAGQTALADLTRSSDAEIARLAKQAQNTTSRYDVEQATTPPRTPRIAAWPESAALPAGFVAPVRPDDPRYGCQEAAECLATTRDLNGDGKTEVLLADNYRIALFVQRAEGVWTHQGDYRFVYCGTGPKNVRDLLKDPQTMPLAPFWPDLSTARGAARFQPEEKCPPPVAVNP